MAVGFIFIFVWLQGVSSLLTGSTSGLERDDCTEFLSLLTLGFAEEVVILQAHPIFRFVSEVAAQFQAMLRGEQPTAGEDVIEQLRADVEIGGELFLGQVVIL